MQVEIAIRPMQWAVLPELHDAPDLDAADLACMEDLRAVLARHGKLERFAIHLAHRHFVLEPGEVLIERPDPDGRTQHVTVGRLVDEPAARPTTWLFDDAPAMSLSDAIYCTCITELPAIGGCSRHGKASSPGKGAEEAKAILDRRIAEEKAYYERGFPVAGHDFVRERSRKRGHD